MRLLLVSFFILCLSGCAGQVMPISNGSLTDVPEPGSTTVVWGNHSGAVAQTVTILQQMGFRIVERSRLRQISDEQRITLTNTADDDPQILKVGKMLGAASIVFVDVTSSSSQLSRTMVNQYGGGSRSETVTNLNVAARGVNVESGEVMWSGMAHYPQAINNPEAGITYLTQNAVMHGLCPMGAWKKDDEGERCDVSKVFGRGMLGFKFDRKQTPQGGQLTVTEVDPGFPADQAGLQVGDILLSCNGKSGFQTRMQYMIGCAFDAGQTVNLQVKRAEKVTPISAVAVPWPGSSK
jgi:hypothetical protein